MVVCDLAGKTGLTIVLVRLKIVSLLCDFIRIEFIGVRVLTVTQLRSSGRPKRAMRLPISLVVPLRDKMEGPIIDQLITFIYSLSLFI